MKQIRSNLRRSKFAVLLVLLAVLPTLVVGWLAYRLIYNDIRSERINTVSQVAEARHVQLSMLLQRERDVAKLFLANLGSQCGSYRARLDQACVASLVGSYLTSENAMGVTLRRKGRNDITIGVSAVRQGQDIKFKNGQLAQFAGTGPKGNQAYFIAVTEPTSGSQLAVTYPSSSLQPVFRSTQALGDSGETFLVDGAGYFITRARYPSEQGRSRPITAAPMQTCLAGHSGQTMALDYHNAQIIHGFTPVAELGSGCIMAHALQAEAFAPLAALERRLLAIFLIFLPPLVLVALYLARRMFNTESALSASENRFRMLFDSASDCLMILGTDGRILDVNRTGHERLGYAKAQMVGKRISEFDAPEFASSVPERMAEIFEKGHAVFESAHMRKDGSMMPVEVSARLVDLEGMPRVFSSIRDIGERKQMAQELVEREARYRAVVETSADGFWVVNLQGRFLEVNDAYARRSGYSREELLSMRIPDVEAKEQPEDTAKHIRKVLEQGYDRFESKHRAKDGSIWPVEIVVSYWPGGGGLLFVFVTDISGRKTIERAVLASEQRYRSLFDNLLDGFVHLKIIHQDDQPHDLQFLEVNETFMAMTGLHDVIGRTGREVFPGIRESNPELFEAGCRIALGGKPERQETYVEKLHKWFAISGYCPEPGYVAALVDDITERKYLEQMTSARLDSLTKQANDIILLADVAGKIVDFNDRAIEAYGYSPEELSALGLQDLRQPDLDYSFEDRLNDLKLARATRFDSVHRRKDGTLFPAEISARLIDIEGEEFLQSITRDISRQKQYEQQLLVNEQRLAEAQQLAKLGSWEWDIETGKIYWSEEMYRIFRYDRKRSLSYEDFASLFRAENRVMFEAYIRQVRFSGLSAECDLEFVPQQGPTQWVSARFDPAKNCKKENSIVRGTIQDITERKQNEAAIERASREVADLYHNAPCGYHSLDKDGLFLAINNTELSWLGYRRNEIVGKMYLHELLTIHSIPVFRSTFPHLKEKGLSRDIELELVTKDGRVLPVMVSASAVMDAKGDFLMSRSTVYDMSERRKLEYEREQNARHLEKLSQRMVAVQELERRWLASELHDRGGANVAALMLNLKHIAGLLPPKVLKEVGDALDDTQALLKDTAANIREVCTNLRPALLDHAGFWQALEEYIQQFRRRTGIAVKLELKGDEPHFLPNVKSTLFRIVQEALTNIVKHAQASEVSISLDRKKEGIVLTISDNGQGFNQHKLNQSGRPPGLGLKTMRERAEFINGKFSYETSSGNGMLIRIELVSEFKQK